MNDFVRVPAVSIGLPVYNGENYLASALDALLAQTFQDFEIVVCDNASTDRTAEIALAYARRDPRIRYHRHDRNLGATANFRSTFLLTKAPLFKWAAHDDLHEPDYLATCFGILRSRPDVVLAHSATAFIDEAGRTFPFDPITEQYHDPLTGFPHTPDHPGLGDQDNAARRFWEVLTRARWGSHMFGLIRRNALQRTKLLADFASSDRALLAELALVGRFKATKSRLYLKRFHPGGSWALDHKELKTFLGESQAYSRRKRQLEAFFSAPWNKPVDVGTKAMCDLMVLVHCGRILVDITRRKDQNFAKQGRAWRLHARDKGKAEGLPR